MRRRGATGRFWPTPIEEGLLRAALLREGGAEAWTRVRPEVDVDVLPSELHRLMPLLARTVADAGLDDPDLGRLRGVRQFTWYQNQRLFTDAGVVVAMLIAADIRPILLRGAATTLLGYHDLGLRPMNDLDLLVPADAVEAAERNLLADGWRSLPQARSTRETDAAVAFVNNEGRRIVLHWRPSRNLPSSPEWWAAGPAVSLGGTEIATLNSEAHLVQIVVDGARALSGSTLRWITDATALLQQVEPEWDRVADLAARLHVAPLLGEAGDYLRRLVAAPVPEDVVALLLASGRGDARGAIAHRLSGAELPRLGRVPELMGRYLRLTAGHTLTESIRTLPTFVQGVLGVDGTRRLPKAIGRKLAAAVTGAAGAPASVAPGRARS